MITTPTAQIIGKRITGVRPLETEELDAFMWDRKIPAFAISLDDGTEIIAAADQELNQAGNFIILTSQSAELILSAE